MTSDQVANNSQGNTNDLMGDFQSGSFSVLDVEASYFDDKISSEIAATEKTFSSTAENAHLLEPFALDDRGFIPADSRHCEDEALNNKLLEEISDNADFYKKLEDERQASLDQNKRRSSPNLLSFLSNSNYDLEAKYQQGKKTKYIRMFEQNTQKILDTQKSLSQKFLVAKAHHEKMKVLLEASGLEVPGFNNIQLKESVTSNPELAEACRMNMAAHKSLLGEMKNIEENIQNCNTLNVCDTQVASDFKTYVSDLSANYSSQLNIDTEVLTCLAPELDKSYAGNVLKEDNGVMSEINDKELEDFIKEIKSLVTTFLTFGRSHDNSAANNPSPTPSM
jgi:hypothetical protein